MAPMTYYADHADTLFPSYRNLDPDALHRDWRPMLPNRPGLACDIGAGSGRDAHWLANQGWQVTAVEPEAALRTRAMAHPHPNITWLDDRLPDLKALRRLGQRYQLILLSAVWMHIPLTQRDRAFRILTDLLSPGGRLVISLRHGSDAEENRTRGFHPVSVAELEHLARARAVTVLSVTERKDARDRAHIRWETVVVGTPDDGTGSLPLLRHIIINDDKSATYKLGLLRTVLRIADGAPGMALRHTDDHVDVPFGLVALYWLKLYLPLVLKARLVQAPSHRPEESRGLGFAKPNHFYQMANWSPFDLRIGATFGPDRAAILIGTLNDICATIEKMPAHFITWPGRSDPVFECNRRTVRHPKGKHWRIDKQTLSDFGSLRIPRALWLALSQYACWVEPAILNEWARLMDGYRGTGYDRSAYDRAFQWDEARRDTTEVRDIVTRLQAHNTTDAPKLMCVWSGKPLRSGTFEIDHCFPWSRWYNNDLWNLLPTTAATNHDKRERLPSAALLHDARPRMLDWWQTAYDTDDLRWRFKTEAEAALPLVGDASERGDLLARVFDGVLLQRARLRVDQGLGEWSRKLT